MVAPSLKIIGKSKSKLSGVEEVKILSSLSFHVKFEVPVQPPAEVSIE